jgi:predicted Zn-ribbon and HTH transcriptional regulator
VSRSPDRKRLGRAQPDSAWYVAHFPTSTIEIANIALVVVVPAQKEECLTVTNSESILLDPGQSLTIIAVPCPNCGYAVGKEVASKEVCPACRERKERDDFVARIRNEILEEMTAKARAEINEKEAHEAKLREEAARVGEQFLQEAKRKEAEAAAEAKRKAAEEVNRKAAEEARRKAAEEASIQEQAAQIRAHWEASLRDARRRKAKEEAEAYMREQYRIQEEAELARHKAEMDRQAEIARKKKEAEDLRKRAEFEEAARRKVEAERSRLGAIAELQAQAELRQARLAEETRRHEEFVKSHQEELARLEADKAKLAEELATLGNFNKDDEYHKIKEEVMKEVNAHGNPMDTDELLKRLNELKTDSTRKTYHRIFPGAKLTVRL